MSNYIDNIVKNAVTYDLVSKPLADDMANEFSIQSTYAVGDYVMHDYKLYKCISAVTTAGNWNSAKWQECKIGDEINGGVKYTAQTLTSEQKAQARNNIGAVSQEEATPDAVRYSAQSLTDAQKNQARVNVGTVASTSIAEEFSTSKAYAVGDMVMYDSKLYKFKTAHSAGAWNNAQVDAVSVKEEISSLSSDLEELEPGLSEDAKEALLNCFRHVLWDKDDSVTTYLTLLENALYPKPNGYLYTFDGSILSSGTKELNLSGIENYVQLNNGKKAYHHKVTTPGTSTTDVLGLKALNTENLFNGDFTLSYWYASDSDCYGHPFEYAKFVSTTPMAGVTHYATNLVLHSNQFTVQIPESPANGATFIGFLMWFIQNERRLCLEMRNINGSKGSRLGIYFPQSINTTDWHHYAITRKDNTVSFFFDGTLIFTFISQDTSIYPANQFAIGNLFGQTEATKTALTQHSYGEKYRDLYISNYCKWVESFDANAISY